MRAAYVDTSCLVAIAFDEPSAGALTDWLMGFDALYASALLEAELLAAFARESVASDAAMLRRVRWVLPDRPLSREIAQALAAGYLRGADLWHVACALFLEPRPQELTFASMDRRQASVAERLGFQVR